MIIDDNHPDFYEFKYSIPKLMQMLVGKTFYFYGTFNNLFKIDDMVLEAIEDPDDGYRSHLGAICHNTTHKAKFHKRPLARVELVEFEGNLNDLKLDTYGSPFHGYILRDVDTNHIWLVVGTDNVDDYYPCFKFWYNPDETQTDYVALPDDYKPFTERYPELYFKAVQWFDGLRIEFKGY
jgi:hypothetical protein